jgi:hypothetical protein
LKYKQKRQEIIDITNGEYHEQIKLPNSKYGAVSLQSVEIMYNVYSDEFGRGIPSG